MIEIISIHIPKTGGTSFYSILQQVYGPLLAQRYLRRDYLAAVKEAGGLAGSIPETASVLHGHFYFHEVRELAEVHQSKLICWLRDPIQRVLSNFRFFKSLFDNPDRNRPNYELNKHRADEPLMEYAAYMENRNRMSQFLEGAVLDDFFFVGLQQFFVEDIKNLSLKLGWPEVTVPYHNTSSSNEIRLDHHELNQLIKWNLEDVKMYLEVLKKRQLPYPDIYLPYQ